MLDVLNSLQNALLHDDVAYVWKFNISAANFKKEEERKWNKKAPFLFSRRFHSITQSQSMSGYDEMEPPENPFQDAGDLDHGAHTSVNPLFLAPFAIVAKNYYGDEDEVEPGNSHADNYNADNNMGKTFSI